MRIRRSPSSTVFDDEQMFTIEPPRLEKVSVRLIHKSGYLPQMLLLPLGWEALAGNIKYFFQHTYGSPIMSRFLSLPAARGIF